MKFPKHTTLIILLFLCILTLTLVSGCIDNRVTTWHGVATIINNDTTNKIHVWAAPDSVLDWKGNENNGILPGKTMEIQLSVKVDNRDGDVDPDIITFCAGRNEKILGSRNFKPEYDNFNVKLTWDGSTLYISK